MTELKHLLLSELNWASSRIELGTSTISLKFVKFFEEFDISILPKTYKVARSHGIEA